MCQRDTLADKGLFALKMADCSLGPDRAAFFLCIGVPTIPAGSQT
jgi:hypothetical protein